MAFRQLSRFLWCKNIRPLLSAPLTTSHMLYATKNSWLTIPSGCTLLCRSAFTHGSIAAASESDPSTAPSNKVFLVHSLLLSVVVSSVEK